MHLPQRQIIFLHAASSPWLLSAGLFCPFAQRVNIVRHLKGQQELLPISVVKPYPKGDETGWPGCVFPESRATPDSLFGVPACKRARVCGKERYRMSSTVALGV